MTLLETNQLKTYYRDDGEWIHAADGIDITVDEGQTLGLVGESGSGKSTVAKSLMRILPKNAKIHGGEIRFRGEDITEMSNEEFRSNIRWQEISMIPQNAMNGFNPVYSVGKQIVEAIRTHEDISKEDAWDRTRSLFDRLGMEQGRVDDYPHQFSGGMAQRAMIALALALSPSLILADEPTTALDVVIQDRILNVIKTIQEETGSAMVMVTHDMSVVSETCDQIAVVYGGQIIEQGAADKIIKDPYHPYTLGLRNAFPDILDDNQELISIPGTPPDLKEPEEGCRFAPRCPFAQEECRNVTPESETLDDGHVVACHRADEVEYLRREAKRKETWMSTEEKDD